MKKRLKIGKIFYFKMAGDVQREMSRLSEQEARKARERREERIKEEIRKKIRYYQEEIIKLEREIKNLYEKEKDFLKQGKKLRARISKWKRGKKLRELEELRKITPSVRFQ